MSSNGPGNNNDHVIKIEAFTDIEDDTQWQNPQIPSGRQIEDIENDVLMDIKDIEEDPHKQGINHDKVSQILSGWKSRRKIENNEVRSSGEDGDVIPPKMKPNWKISFN